MYSTFDFKKKSHMCFSQRKVSFQYSTVDPRINMVEHGRLSMTCI